MLPAKHTITHPVGLRQFIITYDLHKHRDYRVLHAVLRKAGAVRICKSVWLANLRGTADFIRDQLARAMDNDDSLAVIQLFAGADWATIRARDEGTIWLSNNVTVRAANAA